MTVRRSTLKTASGVRLELLEHVVGGGRVTDRQYRVRTLRPNQPRLFADPDTAAYAFDLEVIASLADLLIRQIVQRGEIE